MGLFDDAALGVPAISLKGARRGLHIEGIMLPQPELNEKTGTVDLLAYVEKPATDDEGNVKRYPKSNDVIMEGRFLLATPLRNWDQTSAKFENRAREEFPDEEDDGLRRWFLGSKYAVDAVKAAYKALRAKPEIAGKLSIDVTGITQGTISRGPDAGKPYESPAIKVVWEPATDEGRKVVQAYVDSGKMPEIKAPESQTFPDSLPDPEPATAGAAPWGTSSAGNPPF